MFYPRIAKTIVTTLVLFAGTIFLLAACGVNLGGSGGGNLDSLGPEGTKISYLGYSNEIGPGKGLRWVKMELRLTNESDRTDTLFLRGVLRGAQNEIVFDNDFRRLNVDVLPGESKDVKWTFELRTGEMEKVRVLEILANGEVIESFRVN